MVTSLEMLYSFLRCWGIGMAFIPLTKRSVMPSPSLNAVSWNDVRQRYELSTQGRSEQYFHRGDEPAWQSWLAGHTAFAFVGKAGRVSALKEGRLRGAGYWYAYLTQDRQTRKHYLGPSAKVTFDRLEAAAQVLKGELPRDARTARAAHRQSSSGSSPQVDQGLAVRSPKVSRPSVSSSLVERKRLLLELDEARTHPLTLISASAGSGKTTLLSVWAAGLSRQPEAREGNPRDPEGPPRVAWISLDELDNSPTHFWTSVIAGLRTCAPDVGQEALAMLHSSEPLPVSSILMTLLQDVAEGDSPVILILDDFDVISDQTISESVLFFINHMPANLHLVLSTRADPELPLSRWRVHGQMVEIRDRDLRFTQEEASRFLTQGMGLPLEEADVATLQQRTEGWIAGLQLAALSLRKREGLSAFVRDFAGSHHFLLDYVQEEILAHLPGGIQEFLLHTSILTRMNAALCQAVTAGPSLPASQETLEALERANLFIVPLDEQRHWYRYHDLFREALRARLHASEPQLVPLLHIRAAGYFEAMDNPREAIAHALAAPDYAFAAALMERAAPQYWLSGEASTVHGWVLSLPDAILRSHIHLALGSALQYQSSITIGSQTVHAGMAAKIERTLVRVEEILQRRSDLSLGEAEVALIDQRLRVLRALIEVTSVIRRGDHERLKQLAREMEALPQDEEPRWSLVPLYFTFWRSALLQGEGATLISRLLAAKRQMLASRDSLLTIRVMSWLAFAYTQAAQLHLAHQECLEVLALIGERGARTVMAGYAYHFLFQITLAWNRLEEAAGWLRELEHIAQDWHLMDLLVRTGLLQARLGLATGDLVGVHQALQQVEALIEKEGFANHASTLMALRVQWWLAQGNLVQASAWAAESTLSPAPEAWDPLRRGEALMLARVLLAQRQYARAIETLEIFSRYLDQPGDIDTAIEWMALYVVALHFGRKRAQASHIAAQLLAATEPQGCIRVYLDAGQPMKQALRSLLALPVKGDTDGGQAPEAISRTYVSRLLAIFEQERSRGASDRRAGTELLSPQEKRVLSLLATGQTYVEIAQALIVSPNTIKTQIGSIYRKLGVSRRVEAIELTRHLL
jgi:LuxR family transcriptional regulator, maltose regulon positive regulatory protein